MAQLGARTSGSLLFSRDGRGAAAQAAEILGSMRGLAAKVGQMASYIDGLVPDEHRAAYETALKGLQAAAPTSSSAAIRALVEQELGAPVEQLFAEWSDQPLASASIGQVHRARLADGLEVAVKVQHPGIERAVESDLENGTILQGLVGALGPRALNTKKVYAEIAQRFREELDYGLEAERQRLFSAMHAGDPHIRIPRVIAERSARRVLTTELVGGMSLDEAATRDEDLRRHFSEVLWRFVYKGNLVGGMFNADPHPGNYLFRDDGTIAFLDFGCVQPIGEARRKQAREVHRAARMKDEAAFGRGAAAILGTHGGSYEKDIVAYLRRCFEPLFASPFQLTSPYVTTVVRGLRDLKQHLLHDDGSFTPLAEGLTFMSRLQFGFYSVLARLDVQTDYARVEERFLRESGLE